MLRRERRERGIGRAGSAIARSSNAKVGECITRVEEPSMTRGGGSSLDAFGWGRRVVVVEAGFNGEVTDRMMRNEARERVWVGKSEGPTENTRPGSAKCRKDGRGATCWLDYDSASFCSRTPDHGAGRIATR